MRWKTDCTETVSLKSFNFVIVSIQKSHIKEQGDIVFFITKTPTNIWACQTFGASHEIMEGSPLDICNTNFKLEDTTWLFSKTIFANIFQSSPPTQLKLCVSPPNYDSYRIIQYNLTPCAQIKQHGGWISNFDSRWERIRWKNKNRD